ncbi:uncharacterized protein BXZ73DRAFT_101596 [Epithele typhae]|uniref:uncharacterized protein n=1 Tax=Epithele typhae TaxID=378194 RepID=UPI0020084974|nr:uncharacterized protein BXZ73DRAFT_101596 [Epithele typhae]KAH9931684.1 hypothetical protein BXZ73DRAFT_101596 [Epithele typhae]
MSTHNIVFLKDTWWSLERCSPEGTILEELLADGVEHVPGLVWHGVIPSTLPDQDPCVLTDDDFEIQVTMYCDYVQEPWAYSMRGNSLLTGRRSHYRLVVDTVGYPLESFSGTAELLHATYNVFHALRQAFTKSSRLHRDVSLANIILVREGDAAVRRGVLIDWDASAPVNETGRSVVLGVAGTYPFISLAMIQSSNDRAQTLLDDIESLIYVVIYCAYLWLPHDRNKEDLEYCVYQMFDARFPPSEYRLIHGRGKAINLEDQRYTSDFHWPQLFRDWLSTVLNYRAPPFPLIAEFEGKWEDPEHLDEIALRTTILVLAQRNLYRSHIKAPLLPAIALVYTPRPPQSPGQLLD